MSYTLLELVQTVLSSMDSDEVTSIDDTTESTQVVKVIKSVYQDIVSRADLPEHYTMFNLVTATSTSNPIFMTLPTTIQSVLWLKYDTHDSDETDTQYTPMTEMGITDFFNLMDNLDEDADDTDSFSYTSNGFTRKYIYPTNLAPSYYTVIEDGTYVFNSYDSAVDTIQLTGSKSVGYGKIIPTFTESDNFVPDLDEPQFALLLNECKALAWAELRQAQHVKAEVNAKRGWTRLQKTKDAAQPFSELDRLPNYGRK
jgi:hypothetical protein